MTARFSTLEHDRSQCDGNGIDASRIAMPSIVRDLGVLIEQGAKFSTIYADPPWPYRTET